MSTVDDELTRRLQRAERPVDGDDLFEDLTRRRSHLERVRRVQAGMLALAVLAATAGGFVALRLAFDGGRRDTGGAPLSANGEIVFVKDGDDSRLHIYAAQPDGSDERQITEGSANDSNPAVSPDGQTVAFAHALDQGDGAAIATVPVEGGPIEWQTVAYHDVSNPTWSPDGTHIAFIGHTTISADLYVAEVNGSRVRRIDLLAAAGYDPGEIRALVPTHPSWSPDGAWIAFTAVVESDAPRSSDLARIHPDGNAFEWLPADAGPHEFAPAWSPDGTQIAFLRASGGLEDIETTGGAHEIWTMAPDGGGESLIASADEGSLRLDIAWAPDATSLLVSDGTWISRVNPSTTRDPRNNFVQLFQGFSPSWQPLLAEAEPSVTVSPEPDGRDIGLGFAICNAERLDGIDWYGDGTLGAAWTGARETEGGSCPASGEGEHIVAADLDGDGSAEPGGMGFVDHCLLCRPVATTDLSGDGVLELVVLDEASSTPSYSLYEVSLPTSERSPGIYSLFVAPPGYPAGGFPGGEPIRFSAGGDEGYSAAIDCEGYPEAPILVVAWSNYQVDVDDTEDVYVTRLRLGDDGAFHVIAGEHSSQDVDDPLPIDPAGTACGVAFDPFA